MAATALPPGVAVRRWERRDGTVTASYTVRFKDADGRKRRRSSDTLDDALDFLGKRRSAKRWRPDELRQEQAGRLTLGEFFGLSMRASVGAGTADAPLEVLEQAVAIAVGLHRVLERTPPR